MTDLFGDAVPKNGKAKKNAKPTARAIATFDAAFHARFGYRPLINGGKDGTLLNKLIATWGEGVVIDELIPEFFASTHPRVLRSDYSIGALFYCAQHLRVGAAVAVSDERTATNLDAARRATRRR